jgi:hypothetical protein
MATIPINQKFHTIAHEVDTENRGSASANSNRTIFTMADIQSTIGSIGGSITAGQIAFGAATANSIEGNANITTNGVNLFIPDYIVHTGDTDTFFGFNSDKNFQVQTNGNVQIQVSENHVLVTGQMDLAALNTAPTSAIDTGVLGEIRWAADYVYLCTATDTWVRAALATWL